MITLTATEARRTLFDLIKRANQTHDVVRVQHKSGDAVIMSSEDYESPVKMISESRIEPRTMSSNPKINASVTGTIRDNR